MILKLAKGRTINYAGINKNTVDVLRYVDEQLANAGYGYIQRLAILGNIQRESSGNPLAVSSNGLWHGLIQWDKDRYRLQSQNAQEELVRQTQLLLKELEKTGWSGFTWRDELANAEAFRNATDLRQAVDIFTRKFVRPANIEDEINRRYHFATLGQVLNEDPEYDLETALQVLPQQQINDWMSDSDKNHLSSGYTDNSGNYHYLKSPQHNSWKETKEYERTDPETMRAMSMYSNPNNWVSKFLTYTPFSSGLPESVKWNGLVYNPIQSKQKGGLVYSPFVTNKKEKNNTKPEFVSDFYKKDRFPVEQVVVQTITAPKDNTGVQTSTVTPQNDNPQDDTPIQQPVILNAPRTITPGTVSFGRTGINVGNMQGLIDKMRDCGVSFTIYSGLRPNAMTKSGHRSHHADGNALDIGPAKGQSFDDLIGQILASPELIRYMDEQGYGIINETLPAVMAQTGATGPHFHIGPDEWGKQHFARWLRNEPENIHRLPNGSY